MDIKLVALNDTQIEVVVEDKRLILTDLRKAEVKRRNRKRKVVDRIINTLLVFAFVVIFAWFAWIFLTREEGHYEADYIKDGVLYDTDGDGDYYHWVDPE
jgi:hypothetical protein